jgi:PAS domain S-box-containing protein
MGSVPPIAQPARSPGRVLIVDDNAELVGALKGVLEGPGARHRLEVITAGSGGEALAVARDGGGFDVAIVDVKLPDVSGVDLIGSLREACPSGEVVLITGFASVDAAIGALRSGAFAFVLKSFRPEELISIVEQALGKVALKREREELERRYRDLVELTDVLVVALDADDRAALLNRKAAALAGLGAEPGHGRMFLEEWIPIEDRPKMKELLEHTRADRRARDVETAFGDLRTRIRWHVTPADEKGGALGLVYAIGIDVTERRALEKRAADVEALSAMGELALGLAHEIRNPLNAAVLQLRLLDRDIGKLATGEEQRQAMRDRAKIVGDEIGRLNRLLTEFLDLARPRDIGREPVHVGKLVDDVLELQREALQARNVVLERDIATDGCVAIGDHAKLKQVVLNIVVNALEAMRSGGSLTARVHAPGDKVIVEIGDTGPGIEPQVLARIFDPFFTTKEAGTGLGLSIVRKIVDQHGGDVRVESERGKGTRVIVEIPTGR